MLTKLDSLIKILTDNGTKQSQLNKIIVDYFGDQDVSQFETEEGTYRVLSGREVELELYEIAEEIFYNARVELYSKIHNMSDTLELLINAIDVKFAVLSIKDGIDYEYETDVTLMGKDRYYYIYLID